MTARRLVAAGLGLAAIAAITRPASWGAPIARDTGQYLYMGETVLRGETPYADAANNKGPALFLVFAAVRLLSGTSGVAVRLALLVFAALAALAVAGYVARWAGRGAGAVAGITMAVLQGAVAFEGDIPGAAELAVAPMAGAWWLGTRPGARAAAGAGALASVAGLMSPAFAVAAPFALYEAWRAPGPVPRARRVLAFAAGAAAVALPLLLWIALAGAFDDMVTMVLGQVERTIAPAEPGAAAAASELASSPLPLPGLWLAGLAGCLLACRRPALRPGAIAAALWIAVAWLRVEVASYAFPNQYVPALAGIAAGLALGVASVWGEDPVTRAAQAVLLLALPLGLAVLVPQLDALALPPERRGPDSRAAAGFVRAHTPPGSGLFVVGYDPQVYWLAGRRAPTRYFDPFELRGSAERFAERDRELRANPPAAIVSMPLRPVTPDIQAIIDDLGYRRAYARDEVRIWLRG